MTPSVRKEVLENSRNEGGNGYDWIVRDPGTGRVVELIPVPWYLVEPWQDTWGRIWYTVTHPVTGEPMTLPNEDMIHVKGTSRDGLKGVSVLRRASEAIQAARYHSLAAAEDTLPDCLTVTARTDNGEVMAVQYRDRPVYGLQFHPESILTPVGNQILKNFLEG